MIHSLFKRCEYFRYPFPHWTSDCFFPEQTADNLIKSFPTSHDIHSQFFKNEVYTQNTAYSLEFSDLVSSELRIDDQLLALSRDWSADFMKIIDDIKDILVDVSDIDLENAFKTMFARGDFRACSPATLKNTTQLGPHCDNPREILAGIIYLNDKNVDYTEGGDLIIYKLKNNAPARYMSPKRRIPLKYLEEYKRIPYAYNKAIFFIPTHLAIHGVSVRSTGSKDRRMINLSVELDKFSQNTLWKEHSYISKYLRLKAIAGRFIDKYSPSLKKYQIVDDFVSEAHALGVYGSISNTSL